MCLVQLESDSIWLQLFIIAPYDSIRFDRAVCNVWNAGEACSAGQLKLLNIGRCFALLRCFPPCRNTMEYHGRFKDVEAILFQDSVQVSILDSGQRTADTL